MSFLGLRKKRKDVSKKPVAAVSKMSADFSVGAPPLGGVAAVTLLRPRITEKAHLLTEGNNVYVFEVSANATKKTVVSAIRELYKVNPKKVSVVKIPQKRVFSRGRWGIKSGRKKAYVFLKKGDRIESV